MVVCGQDNPCTGNNECCGGFVNGLINTLNICGISMYYCNHETQTDLCGPCDTSGCYDLYPGEYWRGSLKCQKQVNEYKDCKFTKGDCINGRRQIIINKQANGGVACPTYQYEICNNCEVSEWSKCLNKKKTRTIIKPETNGGTCNDILINDCYDCTGIWSEWSECLNNKTTKTIIKPNTNDDICNDILTYDCYDCTGIWSEWSECDCNSKVITRIKKVFDNKNLSCTEIIEKKDCNNNEKCLKLECETQNKFYNLHTKKCDSIINNIFFYLNLIILFIMNLFKKIYNYIL